MTNMMKTIVTDIREIYEHIGNLIYALAMDRSVEPIDFPRLKLLVSSYWIPRTSSSMGSLVSREGHVILLTMDMLLAEKTRPLDAYRNFEHFFMVYPEVFTNELKKIIMDTAVEIDQLFDNKRPSNDFTISELKKLLYPSMTEVGEKMLH
jgi:hypothetical protein